MASEAIRPFQISLNELLKTVCSLVHQELLKHVETIDKYSRVKTSTALKLIQHLPEAIVEKSSTHQVLKLENEKEMSLGHRMKKDPNVW